MTLTFELDLEILPLDLHAKIQVCMYVCSAMRALKHGHTHTYDDKTITPIADAGGNNLKRFNIQVTNWLNCCY